MTTRYRPVGDNELIERTKRRLVSRVAPQVLDSAAIVTRYTALAVSGLCLFLLAIMYSVAVTDVNDNLIAVLMALGVTGCVTGVVGALTFSIAFKSLLGQADEVEVTMLPDPSEGPTEKPMAQVSQNRIVVGPTNWTRSQWAIVAKAINAKHGNFSRSIIEKSKPGISNLNAEYSRLSAWALENKLIFNEKQGAKNPSYKLTPMGERWLYSYLPSDRGREAQ